MVDPLILKTPPSEWTDDELFIWQQTRRRDDGHFEDPLTGFGDGRITMWAPAARAKVRYRFENGEPHREQVDSVMSQPEIAEIRDEVFKSLQFTAGGMSADLSVVRYAAKLLLINYELSDEDLALCLASDTWHDGIIRHVIGGDGFASAIVGHAPALLRSAEPYAPMPVEPQKQKKNWFNRILKR